jgi:hypothetical protein
VTTAAKAWIVQLLWTVTLLATIGTCGIGVIEGAGSVGLAGESCKHDDCGNDSDQMLVVAGVLGVTFIALFIAWFVLRAQAKAEAQAKANIQGKAGVREAHVIDK